MDKGNVSDKLFLVKLEIIHQVHLVYSILYKNVLSFLYLCRRLYQKDIHDAELHGADIMDCSAGKCLFQGDGGKAAAGVLQEGP